MGGRGREGGGGREREGRRGREGGRGGRGGREERREVKVKEEVGSINLIFEFCVVIVQGGYTPRAWLPSDLASACCRHLVAKSLSNLTLGA